MSFNKRFEKERCPMCERTFTSARKLNEHKRTCPAKEDDNQ